MEVNNPMARPVVERESRVFGVCEGCYEDIMEGEEYIELDGDLLHDDVDCIMEYVRAHTTPKLARRDE